MFGVVNFFSSRPSRPGLAGHGLYASSWRRPPTHRRCRGGCVARAHADGAARQGPFPAAGGCRQYKGSRRGAGSVAADAARARAGRRGQAVMALWAASCACFVGLYLAGGCREPSCWFPFTVRPPDSPVLPVPASVVPSRALRPRRARPRAPAAFSASAQLTRRAAPALGRCCRCTRPGHGVRRVVRVHARAHSPLFWSGWGQHQRGALRPLGGRLSGW